MQTQTAVFGVEFTRRSSQPILIIKKKNGYFDLQYVW